MKETLDKELKRAEEIKMRDQKIQKIMNRMGDVIQGDKDKNLQRQAERDYIQQCLKRDEQARLQDIMSKKDKRQKNLEVKAFLDNQVSAKKQQKYELLEQNKVYIQQVRE